MQLWKLRKSKSGAQTKYIRFDDTHHVYTLHLFRALLRQCTYLPDSAARQYFHGYIVSRFREYHPNNILPASSRGRRRISLVEERRTALLRTARQGLLFLQRANDGHPRHLGKILAMTYGRTGKRRHELLKTLKIPDVPTDQAVIEKMSHPASQGLPHPSRQLQALVMSQARRALTFFSRSNRPTLEPKIPEKNAWGRPMPIKRARNIKRRWYSETIDRVMPPLSETEWNQLQGLASGLTRWEGPVARRGRVKEDDYKHETVRGTIHGGSSFLSSPHELTARYMRRLWTKIFAQCPLMKPDESRKMGWDIRWGDLQRINDLTLQSGHQGSVAMFEGVDEKGRVLPGA